MYHLDETTISHIPRWKIDNLSTILSAKFWNTLHSNFKSLIQSTIKFTNKVNSFPHEESPWISQKETKLWKK
jgi:hypothetical protein